MMRDPETPPPTSTQEGSPSDVTRDGASEFVDGVDDGIPRGSPLCDWSFGPLACFMSVSKKGKGHEQHEVLVMDGGRLRVRCPARSSSPDEMLPGADTISSVGMLSPGEDGLSLSALSSLSPPVAKRPTLFVDDDDKPTSPGIPAVPVGRDRSASSVDLPTASLGSSAVFRHGKLASGAWSNRISHHISFGSDLDRTIPLSECGSVVLTREAKAPDDKLQLAMYRGRWLEARRIYQEREQDGTYPQPLLDATTLERLRRIGDRFDESLLELKWQQADGWMDQNEKDSGLDVSVRLANQKFQVMCSTTIEGFDALQAFVGLCEYDLASWYPDVKQVQQLHQGHINDSVWRVSKKTHWGNEDNIMHVSCIDALDEPIGCLWCSVYTPAEESAHALNGLQLPRTEEGSVRVGFWHCAYIIVPQWTNPPSCKITFGISRRPSSAAYIFSAVMRREVDKILTDFRAFLEKTPGNELNWRALFSSHGHSQHFYDCVRRHLIEKMPPHLKKSPDLYAYMPSRAPLLKLTFPELSQKLPRDWGDYHEEFVVDPRDSDDEETDRPDLESLANGHLDFDVSD